jgi:hypothetical protein
VPQATTQAVFTAHVLRSGSLDDAPEGNEPAGHRYWALASVRERFWGLSSGTKLVMLTLYTKNPGNPYASGQDLFVDGDHWKGLVTRSLPIYETFCTRTAPLKQAAVDLRVLRDRSKGPQDGVRIIGYTARAGADNGLEAVPGTKVAITGPSGRAVATADADGIYDISGLPPGEYEVDRADSRGEAGWKHPACRWVGREAPKSGDVRACTVFMP